MEKIKSKNGLILTIIAIIILAYIIVKEKAVMQNDETAITNSNALTMMYETEAGSGNYEAVSDTTWIREGYVFNEELSRCENGGTLSWNNATNKVTMRSKTSDKCYAYFDVFTIEINYANLADSSQPYLEDAASSYVTDEITYMFDNYSGMFNLNGYSIEKSSVASNLNDVLNYGINSAVYIKDSSGASLNMGYITASGNGALGMYITNSTVTLADLTVESINTNIPAIILNNANATLNYCYIYGDMMISGSTPTTLNLSSSLYGNMIMAENSSATVNIGETLEGQIVVENNSNSNIINNSTIYGCINNENNQNAQIYLQNHGILDLTCDSYVTGFSTDSYDNIYSNGYNIYYDRIANPELDGDLISLDGGGSLMPFN